MARKARNRLFIVMLTSLFITMGLLTYSTHNESSKTKNRHTYYNSRNVTLVERQLREHSPNSSESQSLLPLESKQRSITTSRTREQLSRRTGQQESNNSSTSTKLSSPLIIPQSNLSDMLKANDVNQNSGVNVSTRSVNAKSQDFKASSTILQPDEKSTKYYFNESATAHVGLPVSNSNVTLKKTMHGGNAETVSTTLRVMEERRTRTKTVCSDVQMATQVPATRTVHYNAKHKFYYCPVEKVASTFWRRFIYQLQYTDPVRSPFDVPIGKALRSMGDLHLPATKRSGKELEKLLSESAKLLFVRDPHSRIFSAYIDKLLPPNPYYWTVWGLPAIVRYRENHHKTRGYSHCGHDVTFKEFVKYVINVASTNDAHVMPINKMCTPCAVSYTVIGKMESFGDDIKLLFDYMHLNTTLLRLNSMKRETTLDAIADSATDALSGSWLASSLKCISKEAVLQRIWRKNQIRGFVSWRKNLKLSSIEIKDMKSRDFIKLLTEASNLSTDKEELKIQKTQAMKEAFMTVDDPNLLSDIGKVYSDDIRLFGYDQTPLWLKNLRDGSFINTNAFDYSRPWDLGKILSTKR